MAGGGRLQGVVPRDLNVVQLGEIMPVFKSALYRKSWPFSYHSLFVSLASLRMPFYFSPFRYTHLQSLSLQLSLGRTLLSK